MKKLLLGIAIIILFQCHSCTQCGNTDPLKVGCASCSDDPEAGLGPCISCSAGYANLVGATGCTICPQGTYITAGANSGSCLTCGEGTTTSATGSASCTVNCPTGCSACTASSGAVCSKCKANFFLKGTAPAGTCDPCGDGKFTSASNAATTCEACATGCKSCTSTAATTCASCTDGYTHDASKMTCTKSTSIGQFLAVGLLLLTVLFL